MKYEGKKIFIKKMFVLKKKKNGAKDKMQQSIKWDKKLFNMTEDDVWWNTNVEKMKCDQR